MTAVHTNRGATTVQILCLLLAWLAIHVYWGIGHDAVLYTFQGMYHLHPELLKSDLGLRYGSQDRFSIFGAIFARLIQLLGVDRAAYSWTLFSELAFAFVVWRLARHFMSASLAWLVAGLMFTLPGVYGGQGTLHIIEDFATPRLATEALVLSATLLLVSERMLAATLVCLLALLVHPIMALPGVAMIVIWRWNLQLTRGWLALGGASLIAFAICGWAASHSSLRMDPFWYSLVTSNSKYLLLRYWNLFAWTNNLTPLATLLVGCLCLPAGAVRRLIAGAMLTGVAGLLASALGGDLWHLTIVIQVQPWRCLWFSIAVSTLMLPLIVTANWQQGDLGRASALLLVATYAANGQSFAIFLAAAAVLCAWFATRAPDRVDARSQKLLRVSAAWILGACILATLASAALSAGIAFELISRIRLLDQVRSFAINSALGLLLVYLAWYLAREHRHRLWLGLLGLVSAGALLWLLPLAAPQWVHESYPDSMQRSLASWRAMIPPGTEVMCPPKEPSICWILLQRPSYFSGPQFVTALFARPAAVELQRRASRMSAYLASNGLPLFTVWLGGDAAMTLPDADSGEESLQGVCAQIGSHFLVTQEDLGTPLAMRSGPDSDDRLQALKLYACPATS